MKNRILVLIFIEDIKKEKDVILVLILMSLPFEKPFILSKNYLDCGCVTIAITLLARVLVCNIKSDFVQALAPVLYQKKIMLTIFHTRFYFYKEKIKSRVKYR